jgi:hypothetical protein
MNTVMISLFLFLGYSDLGSMFPESLDHLSLGWYNFCTIVFAMARFTWSSIFCTVQRIIKQDTPLISRNWNWPLTLDQRWVERKT